MTNEFIVWAKGAERVRTCTRRQTFRIGVQHHEIKDVYLPYNGITDFRRRSLPASRTPIA